MAKRCLLILLISAATLASGCASINTNPNILAQDPYNKVTKPATRSMQPQSRFVLAQRNPPFGLQQV